MRNAVTHQFVDVVPEVLDDGVIYVCMQYETVMHRCCCGCGHEVVSPLHPHQWSLTFDGKTISLTPSIGNWSFPCQSHYWIQRNRVHWARKFTRQEIIRLRADEHELLGAHYDDPEEGDARRTRQPEATRNGLIARLKHMWLARFNLRGAHRP